MGEGISILPLLLLPGLLVILAGFGFHRLLGSLAGKEPVARYRRLRGVLVLYGVLLAALSALAAQWLRESDHPVAMGNWMLSCLACLIIAFGSVLFHFLQARKKFRALPEAARRQSGCVTPFFFWQGVFIMLPVAVLAVASLISLRQDERAAENDARTRAAENVQSLGRAMRASVDEELQRFLTLQNTWMLGLRLAGQPSVTGVFPDANLQSDIEKWERDYPGFKFAELAAPQGEILADGRQIEPPDFPAVPRPPKWYRDLTPEQNKLWEALRAGGSRKEMEAWRQAFQDSNPSDEARQAVDDLFQPPEQMIGHSNFLPTEAGISFEEIACYRLLTATNALLTGPLLQSVWWQAMEHPSFVSPKLLALAGGLTNRASLELQRKFLWTRQLWHGQTKARQWLGELRWLPGLKNWNPQKFRAFWANDFDGDALAFFAPCTFTNMGRDAEGASFSGQGYEVWFVPRKVVDAIFDRALNENAVFIPEYASAEVTVEGDQFESAYYHGLMKEEFFVLPLPPKQDIRPMSLDEIWSQVLSQRGWSLLGTAIQSMGAPMFPDAASFDVNFYLTSRGQMLAAEQRRATLFGALVLAAALTALAGLLSARRAFRRQWQLNEQKSNFVSSVSHELRAPIASVRLMAENLERGKISEPARQGEYFRFIVQECRRLSSLIENVLDFSRIEQGRKQYEFEPTNLVALAENTVKLMHPYAAEKGVALIWETFNIQADARHAIGTFNAELNVDGRAIQQALVNLIDNAVKHSPKGEIVTVGIEMQPPFSERGLSQSAARGKPDGFADHANASAPGTAGASWDNSRSGRIGTKPNPQPSTLNLHVSDHGPGIPEAEHEKIFERFYRLGSELRRETQGVGIGLSVVKHIVEAHGGRVRVRSQVGQGSRFTIELPMQPSEKSNDE